MRNAEFDREKVLRSAMSAFMAKGYGKTSMQDLTKATGLHPGSIYCAFDNKRGLLLAAIEQYIQDRGKEFDAFFTDDQAALTQLKTYLDHIVQECLSCESEQACLLIKALNELAEQDDEIQNITSASLASWQEGIEYVLRKAQTNGELSADQDCAHLARYFVMGIYGLRTFAQTHPEAEVLQRLADKLYQDVCGAA
ncbi:TetR/AcrR family transcriptional regulator [Corallincola luteus]|uniref:TetR/AcrR family transcriptional regulator n=1 Tax=Corallincola luteus TaxID=1775177 RepID=A0ABY2AHQ6_9GAMM|nr:TetR/AcrR family transcriptional regulator [Corallincola luteus]TCI02166.1 TetR/AcrR family transcriptional regulator [Corallincola luteus]